MAMNKKPAVAINGSVPIILDILSAGMGYSIVTCFTAAKTIEFYLHGMEEFTGVTIISEKSNEIKLDIVVQLQCGVIIYRCKGGHGKRGEISDGTKLFSLLLPVLRLNGCRH